MGKRKFPFTPKRVMKHIQTAERILIDDITHRQRGSSDAPYVTQHHRHDVNIGEPVTSKKTRERKTTMRQDAMSLTNLLMTTCYNRKLEIMEQGTGKDGRVKLGQFYIADQDSAHNKLPVIAFEVNTYPGIDTHPCIWTLHHNRADNQIRWTNAGQIMRTTHVGDGDTYDGSNETTSTRIQPMSNASIHPYWHSALNTYAEMRGQKYSIFKGFKLRAVCHGNRERDVHWRADLITFKDDTITPEGPLLTGTSLTAQREKINDFGRALLSRYVGHKFQNVEAIDKYCKVLKTWQWTLKEGAVDPVGGTGVDQNNSATVKMSFKTKRIYTPYASSNEFTRTTNMETIVAMGADYPNEQPDQPGTANYKNREKPGRLHERERMFLIIRATDPLVRTVGAAAPANEWTIPGYPGNAPPSMDFEFTTIWKQRSTDVALVS